MALGHRSDDEASQKRFEPRHRLVRVRPAAFISRSAHMCSSRSVRHLSPASPPRSRRRPASSARVRRLARSLAPTASTLILVSFPAFREEEPIEEGSWCRQEEGRRRSSHHLLPSRSQPVADHPDLSHSPPRRSKPSLVGYSGGMVDAGRYVSSSWLHASHLPRKFLPQLCPCS